MTVDDLFRQRPSAYDNDAQRLAAVFSESRRIFAAAISAFGHLRRRGGATPNDLRAEGILHQYMAVHCMLRAVSLFDQSIARALWKARRQRAYFLSRSGRGDETIREQRAATHAGGWGARMKR